MYYCMEIDVVGSTLKAVVIECCTTKIFAVVWLPKLIILLIFLLNFGVFRKLCPHRGGVAISERGEGGLSL